MRILSPKTGNWLLESAKGENDCRKISWSKESCRTRRGSYPWPPDHQSDAYPSEPKRPAGPWIILPHLAEVLVQASLSKQCGPWSDAAECGIWSGPSLFATHPDIFGYSKTCVRQPHLKLTLVVDVERWLSCKGTCHVILHDMYLYKTDNFFHVNDYLKSVSKVALLHRFYCTPIGCTFFFFFFFCKC